MDKLNLMSAVDPILHKPGARSESLHLRTRVSRHPTLEPLSPARLNRTVRLGFRSLWLHRLRSLLTVLGIVFGVCSVIAMLAIGEGASYEAQEQIKSLGSQNIILRSTKAPEEQKVANNNQQGFALDYGLKYGDIRRIQATISGITTVVPGRIVRDYAWNVGYRADCEIMGTVPWYPAMRNQVVKEGRFFTDLEMETRQNVCLIGEEMIPILFPLEKAIGGKIKVSNNYYRVIGVMERRTQSADPSISGGTAGSIAPSANRMFIPLTTARERFGEVLFKRRSGTFEAERVQLHEVTIKVADADKVQEIAEAVKGVLEKNHKKKDYEIIVPLELLKRAEKTKKIFNVVLGSIAAISLIVGGIGIMNIMLASVTERTREIGIRRALGAKQRDIIIQFLVETVMLSGIGGVMGVVIGVIIPVAVTYFSQMKTIVTIWSPLLAFSISAIVGIVFGIYPALKAARMDPVEALRHE